jgi:iron complex outermembrane receptor protein
MSKKKFKSRRREVVGVLGTTSVLCLAQMVRAELPTTQLDEIVITATKRETNLQDTPVAVTAFSQSALDQNHVVDVTDLVKFVPGVAFAEQGDQSGTMITMRGIGNDSAYTELDSPEVAMYVNGIYSPRSQGAAAMLYDVDRIEVLRGPQGTLFGHNSTVGVIDIFSAKPQIGVFAGNAEMSTGNFNAFGTRGMVNLPINDMLAFRVAFATEKHDGYADFQNVPSYATALGLDTTAYVTQGTKYYSEDRKSYRLSGLFVPTDWFTWNLSFENYVDQGGPVVPLMQAPRPGEPLWSIQAQFSPYNDRTSNDLRSNMNFKLNDYLDLTYIGGKSRLGGNELEQDDGGLAIPTSATTPGNGPLEAAQTVYSEFDSYSNELQLKSSGTHFIDWIAGIYTFRERNDIRFDINQYNGYKDGAFNWAGAFIQPDRSQEDRSVYAQAVMHVTDSIRLTGGLRDSFDDERDIGGRNITYNGCAGCGPYTYGLNLQQLQAAGYAVSDNDAYTSSRKLTYLGRVDVDLAQDMLGYLSVGTGYHPGRVEDGGTHDNPETLTNYEIGEKSTFLNGRLTANTAIYYENFQGYQVTSVVTTKNAAGETIASQTEQVNAQGATGYGLEFELAAKATALDAVQFEMAIMKTRLENLITVDSRLYALNPADPLDHVQNFKGNELPHSPPVSLTLGYDHTFELGNGDRLVPHVAFHYEARSWLSYYNERAPIGGVSDWDQQTAYTRTDATLTYKSGSEHKWEAEAFVKNIEDKNIKTNAYVYEINGVNEPLAIYMPPRTFGGKVRFKF